MASFGVSNFNVRENPNAPKSRPWESKMVVLLTLLCAYVVVPHHAEQIAKDLTENIPDNAPNMGKLYTFYPENVEIAWASIAFINRKWLPFFYRLPITAATFGVMELIGRGMLKNVLIPDEPPSLNGIKRTLAYLLDAGQRYQEDKTYFLYPRSITIYPRNAAAPVGEGHNPNWAVEDSHQLAGPSGTIGIPDGELQGRQATDIRDNTADGVSTAVHTSGAPEREEGFFLEPLDAGSSQTPPEGDGTGETRHPSITPPDSQIDLPDWLVFQALVQWNAGFDEGIRVSREQETNMEHTSRVGENM
jgi:hypothetical protein